MTYQSADEVPKALSKRWKRQEKNNRKRARDYGAETCPVDFVRIVIDYGCKCCICFEPINPELPGTDAEGLTLEHIIALGQGGHHVASNIGPAHKRCNEAKNNQLDTPKAAKITRIRNAFTDFYDRLNEKQIGAEPSPRKRNGSQIQSRGFQKPPADFKYKWPKRKIR